MVHVITPYIYGATRYIYGSAQYIYMIKPLEPYIYYDEPYIYYRDSVYIVQHMYMVPCIGISFWHLIQCQRAILEYFAARFIFCRRSY